MNARKADLMVVVDCYGKWFDVACDGDFVRLLQEIEGVVAIRDPDEHNYRRVTVDPRYDVLEILAYMARLVETPGIRAWQVEMGESGWDDMSYKLRNDIENRTGRR